MADDFDLERELNDLKAADVKMDYLFWVQKVLNAYSLLRSFLSTIPKAVLEKIVVNGKFEVNDHLRFTQSGIEFEDMVFVIGQNGSLEILKNSESVLRYTSEEAFGDLDILKKFVEQFNVEVMNFKEKMSEELSKYTQQVAKQLENF
jgi:predicted RNA-binding protein Jag